MATILAALKSRAIWGIIVMVTSRFLHITPEAQESLIDEIVKAVPDILGVGGAVLAIVGRFKAKGPIGE